MSLSSPSSSTDRAPEKHRGGGDRQLVRVHMREHFVDRGNLCLLFGTPWAGKSCLAGFLHVRLTIAGFLLAPGIKRQVLACAAVYDSLRADRWDTEKMVAKPTAADAQTGDVPEVSTWAGVTRVNALGLIQRFSTPYSKDRGYRARPVRLPCNEFASMPHLRKLLIGGQPLNAPLPTEIGMLKQLDVLWINHCAASGRLPTELAQLDQLRHLRLAHNRLTGPIPTEIARMESLELLALDTNRLTGPFPRCVFALRKLNTLLLGCNRFTGPLPVEELRGMVKMQNLLLAWNDFEGSRQDHRGVEGELQRAYCPDAVVVVAPPVPTFM